MSDNGAMTEYEEVFCHHFWFQVIDISGVTCYNCYMILRNITRDYPDESGNGYKEAGYVRSYKKSNQSFLDQVAG